MGRLAIKEPQHAPGLMPEEGSKKFVMRACIHLPMQFLHTDEQADMLKRIGVYTF
jgi:hypothetical protein